MKHYIGIDIAKNAHVATVLDREGNRVVSRFSFENNAQGFSAFAQMLEEVGADPDDSIAGAESTGHYGYNLIAFLEYLGYRVVVANPILIANWRKAQSVRKAKNDAIDSDAIASWLLGGNHGEGCCESPDQDELKTLERSRACLVKIISESKNRVLGYLDIVFPEFQGFFSDDFGKTALAVLKRWPSASALAKARVDAIAKEMERASRGRIGRARAEELKALARSSVGHESCARSIALVQLIEHMEFTWGQLAELDSILDAMTADSPIRSIPGIGPVCASVILGELGDVSRFESPSKIVAFAGCDPSVYESGEFKGAHAHMSKRGSCYLRHYLWLAADRARIFDPAMGEYYAKKRVEGKCHKVAISNVVRKLCAVIFAVLRDGKPYYCPA